MEMVWDCTIIGGGYAGLAAATALAEAGARVLVLERRPLLGGRASSFQDKISGEILDNGQHLFLGCYGETKRYLKRIGSLENLSFDPSYKVTMAGPDGKRATLKTANFPAPFHLVPTLLGFRGLKFKDRWSALKVLRALKRGDDLSAISAADWLKKLGQSGESRSRLWDPLTLATINIDPERAPAELLAVVLREGFLASKRAASVGLPTVGLSDLHGEPSRRFITEKGGKVRLRSAVKKLIVRENQVRGVALADGTSVEARTVICAVPPGDARSLAEDSAELTKFLSPSETLIPSPILSLHLWLKEEPFEEPFLGLWDRQFHWVFRKAAIFRDSKTRHITLVQSGADALLSKSREELQALAEKELAPLSRRKTVQVERVAVSIEREATWAPPIGNSRGRLPARTPIRNLLLAGDWTATGLPATIEGAVQSGHRAAEAVLALTARPWASLTVSDRFATVPPQTAIRA